ncbi:hypothetical protein HGG70_05090, partial [Rhodobacteraceae bacterium R_SAG4]|nr:hypothetical protein [Rhodobacteraceae bacterium R_SAG4]
MNNCTNMAVMIGQDGFEDFCASAVEAEAQGWTATFATLGLPFNEAAFRLEANEALSHLIRTALFFGA